MDAVHVDVVVADLVAARQELSQFRLEFELGHGLREAVPLVEEVEVFALEIAQALFESSAGLVGVVHCFS